MPFLKEIVKQINDALIADPFNDKLFNNKRFYGIAISAQRPVENPPGTTNLDVFPAIPDDWDNEIYPGFDDVAPLIIYHKTDAINYEYDLEKTYGNGFTVRETAQMQMFVWAQRERIRMTAEDLNGLLVAKMPDQITGTNITDLRLRSVRAQPTSTNFKSAAIFTTEYRGSEYKLKPNAIYFQMNYQIEMRYAKNCVSVCEPCTN